MDTERAVENVRHRRAHGPEHRQAAQRAGQHADVADGRGGRGRHRRPQLRQHGRPLGRGRGRQHVAHHPHGQ